MRRQRIIGLAAATAVLLLDQATKTSALSASGGSSGWSIEVLPFFNFVLVRNTGVSFGLLGNGAVPWWTLSVLALAVCAFLLRWLWRERNLLVSAGLGLIVGGALGNVLDRWQHGAVTDFLDFHVAGWHWPSFNLADVGIVCGVAAILIDSFSPRDEEPART